MAASGSSKAPGTQTTVRSASATPQRSSSASAPARSRSVTCPLKRLQATAIRSPVPSSEPELRACRCRRSPAGGASRSWPPGLRTGRAPCRATRQPTPSRSPGSSTALRRRLRRGETPARPVEALEQVAQPFSLGAQVLEVLRVRGRLQRHPLDDVEPVALETAVLRRVVRHEAHLRHPELDEDLGADAVLATVDGKARARRSRRRCPCRCPEGCRRAACG